MPTCLLQIRGRWLHALINRRMNGNCLGHCDFLLYVIFLCSIFNVNDRVDGVALNTQGLIRNSIRGLRSNNLFGLSCLDKANSRLRILLLKIR